MKQTKRNKVKIEEIRRIKLGPGDTLVLKSQRALSRQDLEYIYAEISRVFGKEAPVLILDPAFSLEVVEVVPIERRMRELLARHSKRQG